MVAIRKFAAVALFLGATSAFAQTQPAAGITCAVTSGVPPIVRAEGYTELLGDIVITCTGGLNVQPFLANFSVFLNTNVTSRLVTSSLSEAMLLIDEPDSNPGGVANPFCVSPGPDSNQAGLPGGTVAAPTCAVAGGTGLVSPQRGTYNAFLGQPAQSFLGEAGRNQIAWTNIPVIPPGTAGGPATATRTFRITNLRGNASSIGASTLGLPSSIIAFLSVTPPGTLALASAQVVIGYVQQGLAFDVRNATGGDASIDVNQCVLPTESQRDLFANPTGNETVDARGTFRFREGFQAAFKPRIAPGQGAALPGVGGTLPNLNTTFNSESGVIRTGPSGTTPGLADAGTRLAVRFTNIPTNLRIFVANQNSAAADSGLQGRAFLVQTDINGAGGVTPTGLTGAQATNPIGVPANYAGPQIAGATGGNVPAVEVLNIGGTGVAVWEIVNNGNTALAGVNETLIFPYAVAYSGTNQVGLGTSQVVGSFAPFYAAGGNNPERAQQFLPIPRFVAGSATPTNIFRVIPCQTNLLFPYVTNWAGFDTGIAIANTSDDVFSDPQNRRQAGRCRLNYFGRLPNGNAPSFLQDVTDRDVAAGETITMVLSSGGGLGLRGNANFQGYIIAQCDFQFAHGFAFITDGPIGQARVAEGYLALVLDGPDSLRGQSNAEVRGH